MAKTKKATTAKKIVSEPAETMVACSHNTTLGRCWMCWLFKSLITLFCAFIILWIGFCFGILRTQDFKYKIDPALNSIMQKTNFCSPQANSMSRTMSGTSINMMDNSYASLQTKTGEDFDKEFLIQMIMHHEGGVEMARQALVKTQNEEIKKLAQTIIDAQTDEIKTMQNLNQ